MGSPEPPDTAWRDQAACIGADPRIFTDPQPDTNDSRQAIRICSSCPVKQPCLDIALAHHPEADIGIWGGTTPEARKALRHPTTPEPPRIGLHHTLEGDLTDLSGRARIVELPVPPRLLLLVDQQPVLRTNHLDDIRKHLTVTLADYQPERLAPLSINKDGDVTDPSGRITITRLPTPPHLLLIDNGSPWTREPTLDQARHQALSLLEHRQAAISPCPPYADRAAPSPGFRSWWEWASPGVPGLRFLLKVWVSVLIQGAKTARPSKKTPEQSLQILPARLRGEHTGMNAGR